MSECDTYKNDIEIFGHAKKGYAVEFNLNGVCACRTLTMETKEEAEAFKQLLESRDDTEKVSIRNV